jgi:DNA-binding CsgD family transcriptional regulator
VALARLLPSLSWGSAGRRALAGNGTDVNKVFLKISIRAILRPYSLSRKAYLARSPSLEAQNPAAAKPRLSTRELAIRRDRIFARMLEGQSYLAIAAAEAITPRRVRKIVQEALKKDNVHPKQDFVLVQIARLEGALRLIEQKMIEGKLNAVDRLVKVLERLDHYHAQSETPSSLRRRNRWESAGMLAGIDRIAATRAAVAMRFAGAGADQEISTRMPDEGQAFDIARFADASDAPCRRESGD